MFKSWMRYTFFRKLVSSFLLVEILSVCFLTVILSVGYTRSAVKEVVSLQSQLLMQAGHSLEKMTDGLGRIYQSLIVSAPAMTVLFGTTVDRLEEYRLLQELVTLKTVYPYVASIGVYNPALDRYVGTHGIYFGASDEFEALYRPGANSAAVFQPRRIPQLQYESRYGEMEVLTCAYRAMNYAHPKRSSLIVIHVDARFVQDLLQETLAAEKECAVLLDEAGGALYTAGPLPGGADLGELPQNDGMVRIGGHACLKVAAPVAGTGWSLVWLKPGGRLWADINAGSVLPMAAVLLALILLDAVLTGVLTRYIYRPFQSLMQKAAPAAPGHSRVDEVRVMVERFYEYQEKCSFLEGYRSESIEAMRGMFLRNLLGDNLSVLEPGKREPEAYGLDLGCPHCAALRLELDRTLGEEDENRADRPFRLYTLARLTEEAFSALSSLCVPMDQHSVCVILRLEEPKIPVEVKLALCDLQARLQKEAGLSASAGIGAVVSGWRQLPRSHASAQAELRHRLFLGRSCIVDALEPPHEARPQPYPTALERRLISALDCGNGQQVAALLERFAGLLERMSYSNVLAYARQMLHLLSGYCIRMRPGDPSVEERCGAVLGRFDAVQTLADCKACLDEMAGQYMALYDECKTSRMTETIHEIQSYIEENYADPELTLDSLAGRAGVSASYLSRMFLKVAGVNLSEYLMRTRMTHAAQRLTTTPDPIHAVSRGVGILNDNYFYAVFKKQFGMTPSQYRSRHRSPPDSPDAF